MFYTKGEQCFVSKLNCVFKITWFEIIQKRGVFCFRKQRPSKDFVFKTCADFNPFQKSALPWISKVLQITPPSLFKQDFKTNHLEKFWYLQNVFIKMVSNSTCSLFQNIFCPKSLFGKVYKMVWILKLPFERPKCSWKSFQKMFGKQKNFYKSLDFMN